MLSLHMDAKREQDGGDKKRALSHTVLNTRFAEMVTKCHKFGFFGKIKIQFFKKHFSKKYI